MRLTVRRVKFACTVFVGALMLGVVSNAMLLQTPHPPASVASNAAVVSAKDELAQPAARGADLAPTQRSVADANSPMAREIDVLPVGSIPPKTRSRPRSRTKPVVAKAHAAKTDGITAFLRDTKASGAAHAVR